MLRTVYHPPYLMSVKKDLMAWVPPGTSIPPALLPILGIWDRWWSLRSALDHNSQETLASILPGFLKSLFALSRP